MMLNVNNPSVNKSRTILWIVIIILASIGLFYISINTNLFRPSDDTPHDIVYIVKGNAGIALISYTKANGEASEPEFVSLPWKLPAIRYYESTMVVLTAHNSMQYGEVECIILLDGKEWVQDLAIPPMLNASCGGFVP